MEKVRSLLPLLKRGSFLCLQTGQPLWQRSWPTECGFGVSEDNSMGRESWLFYLVKFRDVEGQKPQVPYLSEENLEVSLAKPPGVSEQTPQR